MKASLSFAALLAVLVLTAERQALAVPAEAASDQPIAGVTQITRGPSFSPDDVLTATQGSLARPRFDNSAGMFGSGGIQPAPGGTGTLTGSYPGPPTVREFSASVMVADALVPGDASAATGASDAATRISPGSTAAAAGPGDPGWGSGSGGLGDGLAGALEAVTRFRHAGSLNRSSVFINAAADVRDARRSSATTHAGLGTVQAMISLTASQALTGASASAAANRRIEGYTIASPSASAGATAATVKVPMSVSSVGYGFLNSSLTVFSDESGAFGAVGQTFNGLTSLAIPEPAPIAVVAAGLAGLAVIRRRRNRTGAAS
nr:PEP-CTERM sorting domain-containing protein [uncultured Rhodopila sp.]